jgi:hypothetical protein
VESLTVTADDAILQVSIQYVITSSGERRTDAIQGGAA